MSIPRIFAVARCTKAACFAIALMWAWGGSERSVQAACGDYLMPSHSGGFADTEPGVAGHTPGDAALRLWGAHVPQSPCHGPNCGQAPANSGGLTPMAELHRGPLVVAVVPAETWAATVLAIDWVMVASDHLSDSPQDGVFRPPSRYVAA